jgi:hypothetical protein
LPDHQTERGPRRESTRRSSEPESGNAELVEAVDDADGADNNQEKRGPPDLAPWDRIRV